MSPEETLEETLEAVRRDGVFLCLRRRSADGAREDCEAAIAGGLGVLEITLTTPGALDLIGELSDRAIVGAGTVLDPDAVRQVRDAGGRFAMSPVFDPAVVAEAHRLGMLAVPGAGSASEALAAHRAGARLVKIFPSGALGGPAFLRAMAGPLPGIPLVPTSGPTHETIADYVAAGAVAVGVGGEVLGEGLGRSEIREAAARVRRAMDEARAAVG